MWFSFVSYVMFLNGFLSNHVTKIWILKLACFEWFTWNVSNSYTLESMTRCLFWVSEGKSSWSSALSPLLKKRTQAKHWRYAERPDVKVAFGLLPFYKRAILKKAKSRCLFFKKCILIFLKCEDISLFQDKPKKIDPQWGWKITTYRSKFATPFLWVVFTGKKVV